MNKDAGEGADDQIAVARSSRGAIGPAAVDAAGVGAQSGHSAVSRPLAGRFNAELLAQGRSERIFAHHLQRLRIERLLDIGSNTGQFATKLRSAGYHGIIYSVEPQASAYAQLLHNAAVDLRWFPLAADRSAFRARTLASSAASP